jgi:acetyl-CoA carboxylase biotin carboxyl carrier protein
MAAARDDEEAVTEPKPTGSDPVGNGNYVHGGTVLIDLDFVKGLIQAVDDSGIDTLEISRAGTRIRISKSPVPVAMAVPAIPASAAAAASHSSAPAAAPPVEVAAPAGPAKNLVDVRSPMVGTFYRAPAPEAPPYVEVGSPVTRGQTLCILEAMKLMNEMESEVDGIVREIMVENADPVEYGQVLFRIEPTKSA